MDSSTPPQPSHEKDVRIQLEAISTLVRETADRSPGDAIALLALLRTLEALHREICDLHFQPALPNNRQALYALLRDIESEGGWPYIPRMKLQAVLNCELEESPAEEEHGDESAEGRSLA